MRNPRKGQQMSEEVEGLRGTVPELKKPGHSSRSVRGGERGRWGPLVRSLLLTLLVAWRSGKAEEGCPQSGICTEWRLS